MWTIEKAGGRRAGSGRERGGDSRIPLAADPACRPLAFSIVLTDREPDMNLKGIVYARLKMQISLKQSKQVSL